MEISGGRGGSQIPNFHSRVRDALRRRFRWTWDRDRGSIANSNRRDDRDPRAKRWPYLSPTAVRRFRSMFSSGENSNASPEEQPEGSIKHVSNDMTPTNTELPSEKHNSGPEMVKSKTGNGETPPPHPREEPQTLSISPNHNASTSSTHLAKASDESSTVPLCFGSESSKSDNVLASCSEQTQGSDCCNLHCSKDTNPSSKNTLKTELAEQNKCKAIKEGSINYFPSLAITPSFMLNETDTKNSSIEVARNMKNLPEPLTLNLEPGRTSPSLTRKSPVTVQEWVDSIPLTSQVDEDPESVQGQPEDNHGDSCPAVTVQPASESVAERRREAFSRDASPSLQSDTGSHGSSVDSYLEARKPDPEEVLLGLGFGGSVHAAEAEVSRIPARFLQPSKVKGVEIDDFLRYQQDLIETFESGYSGYRGLIGGAQIPSVIVAKIMEKLREHERESSVKSSAGSSPGHHGDLTRRRFSRAAQRISILTKMKSRDSIASGGPQAHSVLNPDNRKFLDNQGSKSPEVSRKRMIIGHRSFTFDGDGQLIETEINAGEEVDSGSQSIGVAATKPPPSARPLIHNDSVVSSATSQSLTSYDSDSDAEEISGHHKKNNQSSHVLQRLYSIPAQRELARNQLDHLCEEIAANLSKRRKSLPSAIDIVLNESAGNERFLELPCSHMKASQVNRTSLSHSSTPFRHRNLVDSQPSVSPRISVVSGVRFSENGTQSTNELVEAPFNRITDFSLPEDQNLQMQDESPGSLASDSQDEHHLLQLNSIPKSSAMYLDKQTRRQLSLTFSTDSFDGSPPNRTHISKKWSTSSASSWECEPPTSPISHVQWQEATPVISNIVEPGSPHLPPSSRNNRRGSLKRQQNIEEDDSIVKNESQPITKVNVAHLNALEEDNKGDSFEMEELGIEEEALMARTGSAHSDSSGFQDGLCPSVKQLSESTPRLSDQSCTDAQTVEHLKRLSLPVIRVQDESGLPQWRTSSFHLDSPSPSKSRFRTECLRRSRSLPTHLFRLGDCISPGSISDSIGNMFSSCSDDSVIHLPRGSARGDVGSESEQMADFPLLVAIKQCNKHNLALKKSLMELHSSMPFAFDCDETWTCMNKDLQSLQETQLKMKNVIQHMEGHLCTLPQCNMKTVLEKVSEVALYQSDLCTQLEKISSEVQKFAGILPSNPCDLSNSCQKSTLVAIKCDHSHTVCQSLCSVIQQENHRLQGAVQQNIHELTQIRKLLQALLTKVKE